MVAVAETSYEARARNWYIGGRVYDLLLIVLCPLLAVIAIAALCEQRRAGGSYIIPTHAPVWLLVWAPVLTFLHINIGFARSHLNRKIFSRHRLRFTIVPLVVMGALTLSPWLLAVAFAIAVEWDDIHSSLQTFGFARIYDARWGNDREAGRRLDLWMCLILEYVPHLILLTYLASDELISEASYVPVSEETLATIARYAPSLRVPLVAVCVGYAAFYCLRYWRLIRSGYRIPPAKATIMLSTGLAALVAVTRFTLVEAAVIGNIYHAVQYCAIIWVSERKNLRHVLAFDPLKTGLVLTFVVLFVAGAALGAARVLTMRWSWLAGFWLTTSLMHYWYDSFIWSVRRREI